MPARQVFRPSPPNYVIAVVVTVFLVLLGLVFLVGGLNSGGGAGSVVAGVLLLLLAAFCVRAAATSVLIATPAGLLYWSWTRRRSAGWAGVASFSVGRGNSRGGWPAVIITLTDGTRIKTNVAAYRRSYPARIAAELTALQRQYAPREIN